MQYVFLQNCIYWIIITAALTCKQNFNAVVSWHYVVN